MAFPTTGILDNFNRADAYPLDGNWTGGTVGDQEFALESNAVRTHTNSWPFVGNSALYTTDYGEDQECYVTISATGSDFVSIRLFARMTYSDISAPTGYYFLASGSYGALSYLIDGSATVINTYTVSPAAGVKYGLEVIGNQISVYENTSGTWNLLGTETDSSVSGGGKIGIGSTYGFAGSTYLDDFGGGEISGGVAGKPAYYYAQQ